VGRKDPTDTQTIYKKRVEWRLVEMGRVAIKVSCCNRSVTVTTENNPR